MAHDIGDHSYLAHMKVQGIDAFHGDLCARGIELTKSLRNEPWGTREFDIRILDGHRVMFGEPHLEG